MNEKLTLDRVLLFLEEGVDRAIEMVEEIHRLALDKKLAQARTSIMRKLEDVN